ncbi:hypothetical protein THAOC_20942 [Thalassiosira oceanica]|uniref:RING-type domain-containing protein n=1 Tax=Thalassiosira oceanica TaxID=159749 RepID=K0S258_THAOC|nr:hypothetical protein THAOC_20942 [Thalassiosira oceanica]|eukprot:EJK58899.1 hypothetical protein THAOC_20942 [Thalassiosira oceanica]
MAEILAHSAATVVNDQTCGICLEESKDPRNLPCGHSFCDGCLDEWRSRYGVEEEMRTKCPICRARIPPSKEMVNTLLMLRLRKKRLEDSNDTSSEHYHTICYFLKEAEEQVGADWDGVTVLEEENDKPPMPDYIRRAIKKGDIGSVLRWINANRTEDRANAISSAVELCGDSPLLAAAVFNNLALMSLLLQLGADVNSRDSAGFTAISMTFSSSKIGSGFVSVSEGIRLLLSWGASFFPGDGHSRESHISSATKRGAHDIANLLASELGGRRCEIVSLTSQPELNGKTCVADEYLPDSNQYKVTLETKSKDVLVLCPDNLKRRDRTPQDCGYYIEFRNGRTIRHDFDSSEECQAFVATLNRDEAQPAVTEEAEARAERAAAELLAELGLDDSPNNAAAGECQVKKSKKKKRGKKKKTK